MSLANDGNLSFMEPNIVYDQQTRTVMVQYWFGECNISQVGPDDAVSGCPGMLHHGHPAPSSWQINSTDVSRAASPAWCSAPLPNVSPGCCCVQLGLTWGAPVYLDAQLGLHGLLLGPGNGIQLPDGKLLAIGFGNGAAQWPNASRMDDAAIVSSTDHGHHWNLSYIFQGVPPSSLVEPAIALLPNGSVLANFRTTMARGGGVRPTAAFARATSMSHDGGASWVHTNYPGQYPPDKQPDPIGAIGFDVGLSPDPYCQGSVRLRVALALT